MKVSIIIPTYNEEDYIEATLNSVLAQNYKNIEVIVVDNNSKDKTLEKIRKFKNIKIISEKRQGVQFARESGRIASTGDIVANLDADCLPDKNWVDKALVYFKDPSVVAVSGPYEYYDAMSSFRFVGNVVQKIVYNIVHKITYFTSSKGVFTIFGNVFVRKEVLEKIGGYNTSISFYGDDTDLGKRLSAHGKVLFRNDVSVKSSARRFGQQGVIPTMWKYFINYFWVTVFDKPYHTSLPPEVPR